MEGLRRLPGDAVKVLFAGGCHVSGYPAGEDRGFPAVAQRILARQGIRIHVDLAGYLKLPHRRRLIAKCKAFAPDVLVLQFGHRELNKSLSAYLKAKLGIARTPAVDDLSSSDSTRESKAFVPRRSGRWANCKAVIDTLLGHPLVDFGRVESLWNRLLDDVEQCDIRRVVILSPFPCADPLVRYYRRRGALLFREIARARNHDYIDVVDVVSAKVAGYGDTFRDIFHLGAAGHEAVGQVVAARLAEVLRRIHSRHADLSLVQPRRRDALDPAGTAAGIRILAERKDQL